MKKVVLAVGVAVGCMAMVGCSNKDGNKQITKTETTTKVEATTKAVEEPTTQKEYDYSISEEKLDGLLFMCKEGAILIHEPGIAKDLELVQVKDDPRCTLLPQKVNGGIEAGVYVNDKIALLMADSRLQYKNHIINLSPNTLVSIEDNKIYGWDVVYEKDGYCISYESRGDRYIIFYLYNETLSLERPYAFSTGFINSLDEAKEILNILLDYATVYEFKDGKYIDRNGKALDTSKCITSYELVRAKVFKDFGVHDDRLNKGSLYIVSSKYIHINYEEQKLGYALLQYIDESSLNDELEGYTKLDNTVKIGDHTYTIYSKYYEVEQNGTGRTENNKWYYFAVSDDKYDDNRYHGINATYYSLDEDDKNSSAFLKTFIDNIDMLTK